MLRFESTLVNKNEKKKKKKKKKIKKETGIIMTILLASEVLIT